MPARLEQHGFELPEHTRFIDPWKPTGIERYSIHSPGSVSKLEYISAQKSSGIFAPRHGAVCVMDSSPILYNPGIISTQPESQVSIRSNTVEVDCEFSVHAFTVMRAMVQHRDIIPQSIVLDKGAGSGIMSVLALQLGARHVILYERDAQSLQVAISLLSQNGYDASQYSIIADDFRNFGRHADILSQATVGIVTTGRWGIYQDRRGKDADILAMEMLSSCPNMTTYITGEYDSDTTYPAGTPWSERNHTIVQDVSRSLAAQGFSFGTYFDGEAHSIIPDYSTCAVLTR